MLATSLVRLDREIDEGAVMLDVGGWAKPLTRADWVIDLMPFSTRGMLGQEGEGAERFDESTWVQRDICDREPWPFEAGQFDFAVCSHTLEDVRDPLWVCAELQRVARAGHVEVPSRLEEQSWAVQGEWVGWGHHHWLIERAGDGLDFLFKPHIIHARPEFWFPASWRAGLSEEQRTVTLWWSDGFEARERVLFAPGELDADLAEFVRRHMPERPSETDGMRARVRRALTRR